MRSKILLTLALTAAVVAGGLAVATHKAQRSPYDVDVPAGVAVAPLPSWVTDAEAQASSPYAPFATTSVPTVVVAAFSDTAGVIPDGTVVIADTSSSVAGRKRFGVSPWNGNNLTRPRILGIALGNIPARASLTAGRVLIMGYHANAKMASSSQTANTMIKTGVGVNGSLTSGIAGTADSLTAACGIFINPAGNSTTANFRGKVIINRPMGFAVVSL